eukprot:6424622-Amphidinium_carterae.1
MVVLNAKVCEVPKPALGEHSCEAVMSDREDGHGHHRSHASVGECSGEAVGVNLEFQQVLCDLLETALGEQSCEAVPSNIEVGYGQHRSHASVRESSRETVLFCSEFPHVLGDSDNAVVWQQAHDAVDTYSETQQHFQCFAPIQKHAVLVCHL